MALLLFSINVTFNTSNVMTVKLIIYVQILEIKTSIFNVYDNYYQKVLPGGGLPTGDLATRDSAHF